MPSSVQTVFTRLLTSYKAGDIVRDYGNQKLNKTIHTAPALQVDQWRQKWINNHKNDFTTMSMHSKMQKGKAL